jgi:hypothetical protein
MTLLLLEPQLTETQRAVRDQFLKGGSLTAVLLVLALLAAVVLVVYYLTMRQRSTVVDARRALPTQLFTDILAKLDLTPQQRHLVGAVATALRLENPAVILLSPAVFDRHVKEWQANDSSAGGEPRRDPASGHLEGLGSAVQSDLIVATRAVLFPQP